MTILSEIFAHKRAEVEAQKKRAPLIELQRQIETARPPLDFVAALKSHPGPTLIAEVKKGSPSKGVLVADFNPVRLAQTYAANGAAAFDRSNAPKIITPDCTETTGKKAVENGHFLRPDIISDTASNPGLNHMFAASKAPVFCCVSLENIIILVSS